MRYPIDMNFAKFSNIINELIYNLPNEEFNCNGITIRFVKNDNQHYVEFLNMEQECNILQIYEILEKICNSLSYVALLQDCNYTHHLMYFYAPKIKVHSDIEISKTFNITGDMFKKIYSKMDLDENEILFFFDVISRSLRCMDLKARYFTLFTMIEFIEEKHQKDHKKIFNQKSELNIVKKDLKLFLSAAIDENKCNMIYQGFCNLLSKMTEKNRVEKLIVTLSEYYDFKESYFENIDIKSLIETRNSLFHGRENNDGDLNHFTAQLLELCIGIINSTL